MLGFLSSAQAQSSSQMDELYSRYSTGDGVFAMSLNKEMLDAVDMDFDLDDHLKNVSGDIYRVKFISFTDKKISAVRLKRLDTDIAATGLEEMQLPTEEGLEDLKFFKVYGESKGEYLENVYLLVLTEDETGLFLSLNGKLKITEKS